MEFELVQFELVCLGLDVAERLPCKGAVELTVELGTHELDEVVLVDLLGPCLVPEVVFHHLDIFLGNVDAVLFEGNFEFLCGEPAVLVCIIFVELQTQVDVELLQFGRQWLDYVLNAQVKGLMLDKLR